MALPRQQEAQQRLEFHHGTSHALEFSRMNRAKYVKDEGINTTYRLIISIEQEHIDVSSLPKDAGTQEEENQGWIHGILWVFSDDDVVSQMLSEAPF